MPIFAEYDKKNKIIRDLEVFKAGEYGDKGTFTVDDLDEMVANADASLPHASVNFDHKREGPAYGTLTRLERRGNSLFADLEKVPTDVFNGINDGKIKGRSIEIVQKYSEKNAKKPGGSAVVGLAFLGAKPPQVKDLLPFGNDEMSEVAVYPPIYFSEGECAMTGKKKMEEDEKEVTVEEKVKETDKTDEFASMKARLKKMEEENAELKKQSEYLAKMAEDDRKKAEADRLKLFNERRDHAVKTFCEKAVGEGYLTPRAIEVLKPRLPIIFAAEHDAIIKFSEGDRTGDVPVSFFEEFFEKTEPMALFSTDSLSTLPNGSTGGKQKETESELRDKIGRTEIANFAVDLEKKDREDGKPVLQFSEYLSKATKELAIKFA